MIGILWKYLRRTEIDLIKLNRLAVTRLDQLPDDIIYMICEYLSNFDIWCLTFIVKTNIPKEWTFITATSIDKTYDESH